jgi:hypothetical protein
MSNPLLVYCISHALKEPVPGMPQGVDGCPVTLISNHDLFAVVSELCSPPFSPDIDALLRYKDVTAFFHRHPLISAVIPMRYGCLMKRRKQVERLLEQRLNEYRSLLDELSGCVEMGIRLTNDSPVVGKETDFSEIPPPVSGRDYMARQKLRYESQDRVSEDINNRIQRCRNLFSGLFTKFKSEVKPGPVFSSPERSRSIISLYFLVPGEFVQLFKETFRQVCLEESPGSFLNGPWPPYNFV